MIFFFHAPTYFYFAICENNHEVKWGLKQEAPTKPLAGSGSHTSPAHSQWAPHAPAAEAIATIFHQSIFKVGTDASTLPALPSTPPRRQTAPPLGESIIPRPSPGSRRAKRPKLIFGEAVDVHRSTSCILRPAAAPKQFPHKGEQHQGLCHRLIWDTRIWGFPEAA